VSTAIARWLRLKKRDLIVMSIKSTFLAVSAAAALLAAILVGLSAARATATVAATLTG
jgi:hypothetical protein